jgi:hypothetical protein
MNYGYVHFDDFEPLIFAPGDKDGITPRRFSGPP